MQSSKREGRSPQRIERNRISTASGFSRGVIVCFSLIACISCSQLKKKSFKELQLSEYFQSVCLQSEGKGRLESSAGKYLFDFESLIDKKNWTLAFDFPVIGEEKIILDYNRGLYSPLKALRGRAIKRVAKNKDRASLKDFTKFLSLIGYLGQDKYPKDFVSCSDDLSLSRCWVKTKSGDLNFILNKKSNSIIWEQGKNHKYQMQNQNIDGHGRRILLMSTSKFNEPRSQKPIKLILFLSECFNEGQSGP